MMMMMMMVMMITKCSSCMFVLFTGTVLEGSKILKSRKIIIKHLKAPKFELYLF